MNSNANVQIHRSQGPSPPLDSSLEQLPSYHLTQYEQSRSALKYPIQTRFSSVTEASMTTRDHVESYKVGLKVFRPLTQGCAQSETNCYRKEIQIWKKLRHRNLVPILGLVSSSSNGEIGVIVPWYEKAIATEYLKSARMDSILPMLSNIVEGLRYLHDNHVVHGDLNGANIFIDDDNRALLTDFGFACRLQTERSVSSDPMPTLRWLAPELFLDGVRLSYSTDIYALGSTFLELLTGERPYHTLTEGQVIMKLLQRCSPEETAGPFRHDISVSQELRQLLHRCWSSVLDRPSVQDVTESLRIIQGKVNSDPPLYSSLSSSPTEISASNQVF